MINCSPTLIMDSVVHITYTSPNFRKSRFIGVFAYVEATRPKQQEKSNEFAMLFLADYCPLSPDLAPKISPNTKYEF